ncbi:MAG TPA: hypothetical protein PLU81_01435 [Deltaproteobacteria bacterium]|nr:hypothetical protein [Deltaproteobacteria bacterium]
MASLLPYIKPSRAISRLHIPCISQETIAGGALHFPFILISESSQLTRIIQAQIESDHGSPVKHVFLLLDKDTYLLGDDKSSALNNETVERCWQKAYESYRADGSAILLADQIGEDGHIRRFQPLFYCQSRDTFFHPPCPHCGNPLTLCTDDDLLISCGLQAYSHSLRRYLYCRECLDTTGRSEFYASSPDTTDPASVKDLHHMITGFGSLNEAEGQEFPCPACPLKGECYGEQDLALTRIVPFSFYPFHLLILESASINAIDFLAMLGGASFEELRDRLETNRLFGRIPCIENVALRAAKFSPFLFENEDRFFLEILYLKLSFLGQLARIVFSDTSSLWNTPQDICLDRVWINLSHQESLLPFFWNFQASLTDIGTAALDHQPITPPLSSNYALGILWFHGLLENQALQAKDITTILAKGLQRHDALTTTFDESVVMDEYPHLLGPENIFWNSHGKSLPEEWSCLWQDALGLGWALLKSSVSGESRLSEEDFWKAFENLREEIRNTLFQPGPARAKQEVGASVNIALSGILQQILSKWSAQPQHREDTLEETVVLSEDAMAHTQSGQAFEGELEETRIVQTGQQSPETDPGTGYSEDGDVLETVILSGDDVPALHPQKIDDDIPETVMMKPDEIVPDIHSPEPQPPVPDSGSHGTPGGIEDDLEETILLRPEHESVLVSTRSGNDTAHSSEPVQPPSPQEQGIPQDPGQDDDFAETIILGSDAGDARGTLNQNQEAGQPSDTSDRGDTPGSTDEEDFLAETIILKPDNDKG